MPQTTLLGLLKPQLRKHEKQSVAACSTPTDTAVLPSITPQKEDSVSPDEKDKRSILEQLNQDQNVLAQKEFFIPTQCKDIIICKVQPHHIMQIKQLTSTLLPVRYPDKFFSECTLDPLLADISRVVIHGSKPVGWIRCRLEPMTDHENQVYIQAICILAPWRGLGLASDLLEQVMKSPTINKNHIVQVYAHVWQNSEDALDWYEKRGFTRLRLEPNYYRRLRPAGAWVMLKQLGSPSTVSVPP